MIQQMGTDGCKEGMAPQQVADIVFNAIQEDKFYIFTHPEWMMAAQMRTEEILQERNPTSMMTSMVLGV
jgi:hypothetical protein